MAESGAHRVVALAIDESEHSDNAFHWYCEHIYKEGDYLLLIHVPETYDFTMATQLSQIVLNAHKLLQSKLGPAVVEQLLKELEERVDNLEKKYREKLLARRISGKFRTASGKPGEKIVSVARDERATLIITGTRGLGKFRRTILGSVSDYIVHHSNVPVLVCRWKSSEDTKS